MQQNDADQCAERRPPVDSTGLASAPGGADHHRHRRRRQERRARCQQQALQRGTETRATQPRYSRFNGFGCALPFRCHHGQPPASMNLRR
jgi:hypothetical protein